MRHRSPGDQGKIYAYAAVTFDENAEIDVYKQRMKFMKSVISTVQNSGCANTSPSHEETVQ